MIAIKFEYFYLPQWHLGMYAEQYLPMARGFESHYGYYQGAEDYYDHTYEYDKVLNPKLFNKF